jgi:hypothetical protein
MSALCQLEDLKLWMQIPTATTSEDSLLSRLIDAVSADFLQAIKRPDLTPAAAYTELRAGNGTQETFPLSLADQLDHVGDHRRCCDRSIARWWSQRRLLARVLIPTPSSA